MLSPHLSKEHLETWRQQSYLVCRGALSSSEVEDLQQWVEDVSAWPETAGKWMKYFESGTEGERQLCRVENFVPYHPAFAALFSAPEIMAVLKALMGEPAVLFKEKINFKLPGGAGFGAHQDAPAFAMFGHRYHITMMVAVDDATQANGCLEMSDAVATYTHLPQNDDGTVATEVEGTLPWRPVELMAGDIVFFDSYVPHRSAQNTSSQARRALYVTYNRRSEGDVRAQYFKEKRSAFPPECERAEGIDYLNEPSPFNLGNPIR